MPTRSYPVIPFKQYGSESDADKLLLFAAPAKAVAAWAGIPRKAWHIRMLFQRPITATREADLKRFWDGAGANGANGYQLGPTAIVVAIQGAPTISAGGIDLSFQPVVDLAELATSNLPTLVSLLYDRIRSRLNDEQRAALDDFAQRPFDESPEIEHDYVFEFALQMAQMRTDPVRFVAQNAISEEELQDIVSE